MTLQRGLAVYTIFWSPPPSVSLQPPYCAHTLLVLCVYTHTIWVLYASVIVYSVYVTYTVVVHTRTIFAHDHTQRGLCVYWVFDLIYMYMHWRTLIEDHWLYIALVLWTSLSAFAVGLLIGFIWILFIWAIPIFIVIVYPISWTMIPKMFGC